MKDTLTVTIFTNRSEFSWRFPARWSICSICEGCGTDRGASVECDGGGFTASEWADQDEDFRADYLAGSYDQPCRPCKGLGRIQVIDRKLVTGWRNKILLKTYQVQERDSRETDAIHAAERRMGA